MSVHVLRHLGEVTTRRVVIKVTVTNDGLLFGDQFEVLADLLEVLLVWVVPGTLLKEVLGVLVGSIVGVGVEVDFGAVKACPKVIDSFDDLTTHLSHFIEWR